MSNKILAAGFLLFARCPTPQFLLLRHRDRWDLPKGHVEQGESLLEAALRETHEETGIEAALITPDPDFRFSIQYPVYHLRRGSFDKQVTYFLGYLNRVVPVTLTEHESYHWWPWPCEEPIQAQTIDPLLDAVRRQSERYPERFVA